MKEEIMEEKEEKKELEFHINPAFSVLPFVIFIVVVIYFSISKAFSLTGMIAFGVVGLIIGSLFSKSQAKYWDAVMSGITDPSTGILTSIFLVVGVFSQIIAVGNLAGGFVWIGNSIGMTGSLFCGFTFFASAMVGLATGTSVGTTVTLVPVFYPAGVLLGANPILLAGAILSGASFGDNLAPVSDTTIISASSQKYSRRSGTAEIGGTVRTRAKYSLIAALLTLILYLTIGGRGILEPEAIELLKQYSFPKGLFMLIPVIVVITIALRGRSIFTALIGGIISGLIVGLSAKIFTFYDLLHIEEGAPVGMIVKGVSSVFEAILLFIIVMGMFGLLKKSGTIDTMVNWISRFARTPRSCEMVIFLLITVVNFISAGVTTMTVAVTGPLADSIGKTEKLHPYRRANIVSAISNTWNYFIPWSAFIFIFISIVGGMKEAFPFLTVPSPNSFFFAVFYPWVLWFVMLIAIITGYGRDFEGVDGRRIKGKGWFNNKIPEEAIKDEEV